MCGDNSAFQNGELQLYAINAYFRGFVPYAVVVHNIRRRVFQETVIPVAEITRIHSIRSLRVNCNRRRYISLGKMCHRSIKYSLSSCNDILTNIIFRVNVTVPAEILILFSETS